MKISPLKHLPDAHSDGMWATAWAPASQSRPHAVLLTGSVDESVKLWEGDDLACLRTNQGHALGVVSLAASPLGTIAASSSLDCFVRVFDVDSNATVATLDGAPAEAWGLSFMPESGSALAVAGGCSHSVKLWSTDTWKLAGTLELPAGVGSKGGQSSSTFVTAVAWSADGKRVACSTMDGTVAVFDPADGRMLHTLPGHHLAVRSLAFSPVDSRVLYTASDDRHIHMYDAEGKTLLGALSGHASWVLSVAASPDGLAIASGSCDFSVRLWDTRTRTLLQVMKEHQDQVWGVAFRPPSPASGATSMAGRLASVSEDKSISLYDYS